TGTATRPERRTCAGARLDHGRGWPRRSAPPRSGPGAGGARSSSDQDPVAGVLPALIAVHLKAAPLASGHGHHRDMVRIADIVTARAAAEADAAAVGRDAAARCVPVAVSLTLLLARHGAGRVAGYMD